MKKILVPSEVKKGMQVEKYNKKENNSICVVLHFLFWKYRWQTVGKKHLQKKKATDYQSILVSNLAVCESNSSEKMLIKKFSTDDLLK